MHNIGLNIAMPWVLIHFLIVTVFLRSVALNKIMRMERDKSFASFFFMVCTVRGGGGRKGGGGKEALVWREW